MFYRIDGIADGKFGSLSARRFVTLAERVVHYQGSITALARLEYEQDQQGYDGFELPGGGDEQDEEPAENPVDLRLGMETL